MANTLDHKSTQIPRVHRSQKVPDTLGCFFWVVFFLCSYSWCVHQATADAVRAFIRFSSAYAMKPLLEVLFQGLKDYKWQIQTVCYIITLYTELYI